MSVTFAVSSFLYWFVGVVVVAKFWLDDFDEIDLVVALLTVTLFWFVWPFVLLVMLGKKLKLTDIIVVCRRRE